MGRSDLDLNLENPPLLTAKATSKLDRKFLRKFWLRFFLWTHPQPRATRKKLSVT